METLHLMIFTSLFITICLLLLWDGLDKAMNRAVLIMAFFCVLIVAAALAIGITEVIMWIMG